MKEVPSKAAPRRRGPLLTAILAATGLALVLAVPAAAQTFTVTKLTDSGVVAGDGTLRGEIRAANEHPGPDTVVFQPGLTGEIAISGSGYVISGPIEIDGPGAEAVNVHQTTAGHRVIQVNMNEPGAVTISGLELSGGETPGPGGDLEFDQEGEAAEISVIDCTITEGIAQDYGGGIAGIGAPLTVRGSLILGNEGDAGGGIWAGGEEPLTIEDSEIAGNESMQVGGGLDDEEASHTSIVGSIFLSNLSKAQAGGAYFSLGHARSVTIADSTANGNETEGTAGGFYFSDGEEAPVVIEDSTIAGNHAGAAIGDAGGIENGGPTPQTLIDTIVSGNSSGGSADVGGAWTAAFSLIGDPTGTQITSSVPGSNLLAVDPQLLPPAENGGPMPTMALRPTSPAVNRGGGSQTVDARGDPRPVIFPGVPLATAPGANGADIGAYELQAPAVPAVPAPPVAPPAPAPPKPGNPRVRLACPKSAGSAGCTFRLLIVSGRPRRVKGRVHEPTPESAVAKLKLGAGKSGLLALRPKARYANRLDLAKTLLVRQTEKVDGKSSTLYRRLRTLG